MAKKNAAAAEAGAAKKPSGKKLLELAREHQNALMSAGLHEATLTRLETALKGLEGKEPNAAAQTLLKDVSVEAGQFQSAIKKEFPGNVSFQSIFKADQPLPTDPHEVLALGRTVAKEAPDFGSNFIKYALNAASWKHLTFLCDQLEKELGGADPRGAAKEAEEQILEAASRAFEGKAELAQFTGGK